MHRLQSFKHDLGVCLKSSFLRHSGARFLARARNPYSRWWLWIPGLRQEAHPEMTVLDCFVADAPRIDGS
jgi:hypothetical protein